MSFWKKEKKNENFVRLRDDQDGWFFFFSVLFLVLTGCLVWILFVVNDELPQSIAVFDFILIILAVFRLTRLFVYDAITKFVRNWFLVKRRVEDKNGEQATELYQPEYGARKTLMHLFGCPWCVAVWFSVVTIFFYFLTPVSWIVIFILAVSGVASLFQIFANFLGWSAELRKEKTQKYREK